MQQHLSPALGHFAQPKHGIQFLSLNPLELIVTLRGLQHLPEFDDILQAIHHPRGGRLAIPARPARFLVIGFQAFWEVQMGDKTHIRFIDAHAKGNGCHHNNAVFPEKTLLIAGAVFGAQPGMVGQCGIALAAQ